MKKHFCGFFCALLLVSIAIISWKPSVRSVDTTSSKPLAANQLLEKYIDNIYESAHLQESGLEFDVFKKAVTGFLNLRSGNKIAANNSVLTVIDFNKPSREKRMWIVNVLSKELLMNTWVAHGEESGDDLATRFSDKNDSHKSSLGFYLTDDVYYGKHGRSLRLDGMDAGFNKNAREREIVVHAAGYVCQSVIDIHGRLGRSFGCPAVAPEVADEVIDAIKDRSVMFITGPSKNYNSKFLDESAAANTLLTDPGTGELAGL